MRATLESGSSCYLQALKPSAVNWGQPGVNLGSTWGQPGVILGSTWGQPWDKVGLTGGQPGVNLGSTWGQPGVNLGSTWGQPGVNLGSTCGYPGVNLGSTWGQPGVILGSTCTTLPWSERTHHNVDDFKHRVAHCEISQPLPLPSSKDLVGVGGALRAETGRHHRCSGRCRSGEGQSCLRVYPPPDRGCPRDARDSKCALSKGGGQYLPGPLGGGGGDDCGGGACVLNVNRVDRNDTMPFRSRAARAFSVVRRS